MSEVPAEEAYLHMGFQPFSGEGPHLSVAEWKRVQHSNLLADVKQRYQWQQELAGKPLIDHGFVVGSVPPLRLGAEELQRLLSALEQGIAQGCRTVADWQRSKATRRN